MRLSAAISVLLIASALSPAAAGDTIADTTRALDDSRWEVRRLAERRLETIGKEALEEAAATGGDRGPLKDWSDAIGSCLDGKSFTAAAAAERCLRRLETKLDDSRAKLDPRLLRARLERLLPQTVEPWKPNEGSAWSIGGIGFAPGAGDEAVLAVTALLPEALPVLLTIIDTSTDPRRLAGALAVLAGERRSGGASDAVLHRIAQAWTAAPDRLRPVAAYATATSDGTSPLALVALALAVEGRVQEAVACLKNGGREVDADIQAPLLEHLKATGRSDLTYGRFLVHIFEGTVSAADLLDAAKTALSAGVPWIARMTARRALFLAPDSAEARGTLVRADEALGLRRTAREDAKETTPEGGAGAPPPPPSVPEASASPAAPTDEDDKDALAIDQALRAGALGQRLLSRVDVGASPVTGVVPVAVGSGVIAYGHTSGHMVVADAATRVERYTLPTSVPYMPRSAAISGNLLAAITYQGRLSVWSLGSPSAPGAPAEEEEAKGVRLEFGPYLAVAAAPGGGFYVAGLDRRFTRYPAEGAGVPVEIPAEAGFRALSLGVLADGRLLAASLGKVIVVDPKAKTVSTVIEEKDAAFRAAPLGNDVVVAMGSTYVRLGADGKERWRRDASDAGLIVGIAADRESKTVYLVIAHEVVACDAVDGSVRWVESIEGSGSPAVGEGLIVVPAGSGTRMGGDNRADRTVSFLRASTPQVALFEAPSRAKIVEAAEDAAQRRKPMTAEMLIDPLLGWFPEGELSHLNAILRK